MKKIDEYCLPTGFKYSDIPQVVECLSEKTEKVQMKIFPKEYLKQIPGPTIQRYVKFGSKFKHPNIVQLLKTITTDSHIHFVYEFCERSLKNDIQEFKHRLPEPLIAKYVYEILEGLEFLKKENIEHNNLKASNCLLKNGVVKLIDFGLGAHLSLQNKYKKPYWYAPEVLESNKTSEASDVWALGCTVIEILTGSPPYMNLSGEEAKLKILSSDPVPLPSDITEDLRKFLAGCLEKSVSKRFTFEKCKETEFVKSGKKEYYSNNTNSLNSADIDTINEYDSKNTVCNPQMSSLHPGYEFIDSLDAQNSTLSDQFNGDDASLLSLRLDDLSNPPQSPTGKDDSNNFIEITDDSSSSLQLPPSKRDISNVFSANISVLNKYDEANYQSDNYFSDNVNSEKNDDPEIHNISSLRSAVSKANHPGESDDDRIPQNKDKVMEILRDLKPELEMNELQEKLEKLDNFDKEVLAESMKEYEKGIYQLIEIISIENLSEDSARHLLSIISKCPILMSSFKVFGGIPFLELYLDKKYSLETRLLVLDIFSTIAKDKQYGVSILVACRSIKSLHSVLESDDAQLYFKAIEVIEQLFEHVGSEELSLQPSDFGVYFVKTGLIEVLASKLRHIISQKDSSTARKAAITSICSIFERLSGSDEKVQKHISEKSIMEKIVGAMYSRGKVLNELDIKNVSTLVNVIKNLAARPHTLDSLEESGVTRMTCALIKHYKENRSLLFYLLQILYFMCKLSFPRTKIVAEQGIAGCLKPYFDVDNGNDSATIAPLALNVLYLFHSSKASDDVMRHLIQDDGLLDIYILKLQQHEWGCKMMVAISELINNHKGLREVIYEKLEEPSSLERIRGAVKEVSSESAPTMLEAIKSICAGSSEFTKKLTDDFFSKLLLSMLEESVKSPPNSQVPYKILCLLNTIIEVAFHPIFSSGDFISNVTLFSKEDNLRQKDEADQILKKIYSHNK